MDIESILKNRDLSTGSIELYKIKISKLNDNKPIKNFNFLKDIDKILKKISHLKPSTSRSYIITICSILKSLDDKRYKSIYDKYRIILEKYNGDLKDNTEKTDKEIENWISISEINTLYQKIEKDVLEKPCCKHYQNLLIISLYTLIPPRRSKDFLLMKVVDEHTQDMSKEFNYFDIKNKEFIFENYKTSKSYGQQVQEIPEKLYKIVMEYIKYFDLKLNDFLIVNPKTGKQYNSMNSMTLLLNNIFKRKISVGMLRKIYLSEKYSDVEMEKKLDAERMSTSVSVMGNNYIKR